MSEGRELAIEFMDWFIRGECTKAAMQTVIDQALVEARQEGIEQAAKVAESITGKYGEGDYELGRMHASEDITEAIRTLKDGKGNNNE